MNIEEAVDKVDRFVNTITIILPKYSTAIPEYCIDEESWLAITKLLTAYEKEKEKNKKAKWYIHQEIVRIEEDIEDYLDDDKEGNKQIIGEFKEDLEHWKDVEKLLDGKPKDKLYMDWRKYGEYE